jgi:hypothetical protein
MILEIIAFLYYTLATISILLVLYQKYNVEINIFLNKWFYNYIPLNTEDNTDDNNYILYENNNKYNEEGVKKKNIVIDFT